MATNEWTQVKGRGVDAATALLMKESANSFNKVVDAGDKFITDTQKIRADNDKVELKNNTTAFKNQFEGLTSDEISAGLSDGSLDVPDEGRYNREELRNYGSNQLTNAFKTEKIERERVTAKEDENIAAQIRTIQPFIDQGRQIMEDFSPEGLAKRAAYEASPEFTARMKIPGQSLTYFESKKRASTQELARAAAAKSLQTTQQDEFVDTTVADMPRTVAQQVNAVSTNQANNLNDYMTKNGITAESSAADIKGAIADFQEMYPRQSGAQSQNALFKKLMTTTYADVPLTSEQVTNIRESIADEFTARTTLSAEDEQILADNKADYISANDFNKNSYNPLTFSGDYNSPGEMFTDEDSSIVQSLKSFFTAPDGRKQAISDGRDILVNGVTIPGKGENAVDVQVPITMDMLNDAVQSISDQNFAPDTPLYTIVQEYAIQANLYEENQKYKEQEKELANMERAAKRVGGSADSLNSPSAKAMRTYGNLLSKAEAREQQAAQEAAAAAAQAKADAISAQTTTKALNAGEIFKAAQAAQTTQAAQNTNAGSVTLGAPLFQAGLQAIKNAQKGAAVTKTLNTAILSANAAQDFSKLTDTDISSWIRTNTQVGQRGRNNAPSAVVNSVKNILNQRNNP